ncbi:TonB-dependent receptor [Aliiglaciecola lipolytica]|uniref:Iron complex outermembrane recepter protein n=1 Tax=Aliiglaciecola lipolytica E3 TaxID=1127673 RepID=K6YE27_9ALTE|nr:TonB-dependent receptor [Aliiglaciecola lipolytica]GAC16412.1 iron complex outermembrane recepter protein [Aliiglaciecola lipolytica E3]
MLPQPYSLLASTIFIALSVSNQAIAQTKPIQKDEQDIEKLVITSNPLNPTVLESATPVSIIAGDDLESRIAPTLGETLKNVPGVHSTYFGPVSSSPIIRGLDGPRVKVLQNGLDVSDASRVGPDHVVSTESANATQIEVLRGPATLLYGSGAIGGVVNIVDNRLPTQRREEIDGKVSYLHDSVSSEDLFNLNVDGGNNTVMWHFDAFDRQTENYKIPGSAEIDGTEDSGELDNSFIDASGFTAGLGWASDNLNVAFSFGQLDSDYGIPGHSHHDEHEEEDHDEDEHEEEHDEEHEEEVFGRLKQDRYQFLVDFHDLDGFFTEIKFRNAYTDYNHSEIEDGEIGTTFTNESFESRLWGKHRSINGWEGVLGLNYTNTDFSALGEEAFTPASESDSAAIFLLEEKHSGAFLWQLGFRYEKSNIAVDNSFYITEDDAPDIFFEEESFSSLSLSAGVVWSIRDNATLSFNYARSERAPSAAELFSNGLHIATSTYELGAAFEIEPADEAGEYQIVQNTHAPEKEISNNIDITYQVSGKSVEATFSMFYNQIDNYLFQQNTGLVAEDGHIHNEDEIEEEGLEEHDHEETALPIYLFRQQNADIYGLEAEVDWHLSKQFRLETFADITKAELSNGENLPRIPPARIGFGLHFESDYWHAELGATYNAKQDNIAEYETETAGYTLVNAAFNYYIDVSDNELVLFVRGNNLLDKEARVHASFIKDTAPLPGRSIVVGARMHF